MNRYGKRCVLYPRVSTEMQVDGYSLEGQKNMLTRFADREEMIVVDTYEDAGKSGKSIEGRPAFQKMLRDIEDGLDIDYILVYKLSRFGRNAADILNSLELVQSYGVNLICIEEGIDSSQTSGKLLISVLSAVAEIERENIIEQTMNGRREKARQGGWNGGFAPYGYTLEDNKLMIEETEAVAIRKIFELYTSSEIGLGGIANQLNLQGIRKIPRQNGTLEDWTGHFIKLILDNPVYCGKIAYGRRTKEKVKGTKNDYQMKRNDDYILTEGQHKGIVSEEVWEKAHAKRLRTGVKQPSKIGRDRVHLLSGLLKCPVCGSPMYTNKHAWTNKDGTYKEIYYYVCSRNRMVRGKHCEYKAMLKKTDIEPMVIEAIREIVRNEEYAQAIKKRIGVQIDTKAVDKELEGYQAKLKEVDLNKTRLEREIDSLPADAKYRERKLHDMTLRLDSLYDVIVELEEKIEDARLRRDAIKQQAITLENIYKIMVNFDCVYNIINDEEKRNVVTALIKEIEIYRNDESEYPLKRIGLNFPVFKDGGEVTELLWDKGNTVDTRIMQIYLEDTGAGSVANVMRKNVTRMSEGEIEMAQALTEKLGEKTIQSISAQTGESPFSARRRWFAKYGEAVNDALTAYYEQEGIPHEEALRAVEAETTANKIKSVLLARKYLNGNAEVITEEVDREATDKAIREKVNQDSYDQWLEGLFSGVVKNSGIYNGKDYYTASGNRRSFSATHYEVNLENTVRAMKQGDQTGVGTFFGGQAIWGVTAKDYRSIEEIKEDSGRLQKLSEEEYSQIRQQFTERLADITSEIMDKNNGNEFTASDDAASAIVETLRTKHTVKAIDKELRTYPTLRIQPDTAQKVFDLCRDISNMPTGYFEAKPQRAVGFDEAAAVVVPDNLPADLRKGLEQIGATVREYKAGDEQSRLEAVNADERVRFQQRDPRLSDRDVLRMAADMAQRDRSQRWSVDDLNRFDMLQRKLLQLDEANAELEALKKERKVLLAGRKVKELTRDEQFELAQNRNRTETQKGKMFVNRIQRVARNNIS